MFVITTASSKNWRFILGPFLLDALERKHFKAYAALRTNLFLVNSNTDGKTRGFEKLTADELKTLRQQIRRRFIPPDVCLEFSPNMTTVVKKLMLKTRLAFDYNCITLFDEVREIYE